MEENEAEYLARMERFGNVCAVCGRTGQAVIQSLEGKGFYYCETKANCKSRK